MTTTLEAGTTPATGPVRTRRRSLSRRVRGTILTTVTWIAVLAFFFPVVWMVFTAFKPESQAATLPPTFWPDFTTERFAAAFSRDMIPPLINSASASLGSTLLVLVLAVPAAYALSVRPIKNVRDALFFLISTKFMPIAASIIPVYLLLQAVGGLDNITWLTILYIGVNLPIAVWMLRSFLAEVPREVIEAAQIDGAGLRTELFRVVLPIVLPGVAAAGLICFIFAWNEFFLANLLTTQIARTTPPVLGSFVDGRGQFLSILSAASTIAIVPVVIAGWIAQKQLVRGLAMGAIK